MFRAALKSLLGRKVRLLMSTFAIVIGVSFVVGTLVFSDTLSRSFTALMASTVGDVVVRPANTDAASEPTTRTVDADAGRGAGGRRGRSAGRRQRHVVRRLRRRQGRQAGRRQRPAQHRRQLDRRAGRSRPRGDGHHRRPGAGEGGRGRCSTPTAAGEGGYVVGQDVDLVTATDRGALTAELVGVDRASPRAARSTVRPSPPSTPRPPRTSSSTGKDAFTDIWVTAEPGTSQEDLAAAVAQAAAPTASRP